MKKDKYAAQLGCIVVITLFFLIGTCDFFFFFWIRVSPAAFCIKNAAIGEALDLGLDMVITNMSGEEEVFTVKPLKPSQVKESWLEGYGEIPDPSWFSFSRDTIKIGPNSVGKLRMHLMIPGEEKYLNQHWMVYVEVTTVAVKGQMFKTAIKPNYMIETKAESDIKGRPYGILGLVPGTVRITDIPSGEKKRTCFRIYNNDTLPHTYMFTTYIPKRSTARQDISISPGYEWIKDTKWVRPKRKRMTLKAGEVKDVSLKVFIPKGAVCKDLGWESIILVEPDKGISGFVRIQIEEKE